MTLEGDKQWHDKLKQDIPGNVNLFLVSMENPSACVDDVNRVLQNYGPFDVIVLDGLYRTEMIEIAIRKRATGGAIICDNAEGYGIQEGFQDSDLRRIDFFGNVPGVILPQSTSMFFKDECFLLSPRYPIPNIALEKS